MNNKLLSCDVDRTPLRFKPDKVWVAIIILLLSLLVYDQKQAFSSVVFVFGSVTFIGPFFLLAILLAASIKATGVDKVVAQIFSGNPLKAIFIASIFGALSPFCSCGVIPLVASLLAAGVPLAPVMAFWIASPIMDPEMFVLTAASISFDFALAKALFAILMGLFAGFAVNLVQYAGFLNVILSPSIDTGCNSGCIDLNNSINYKFWQERSRIELFKSEFIQTSKFLGKWLLLAFFIESLMVAYINPQWLQQYVGGDSLWTIPIAALIGMPSYLNGYAAIPMVGGLMDLGMSPGAAMAFMLTGAVSSIPAAIAVYALVRKPVFVFYLLIGLVGSVLGGVAFQMMTS